MCPYDRAGVSTHTPRRRILFYILQLKGGINGKAIVKKGNPDADRVSRNHGSGARLGVSRTQLREVVLGNRQSKRLMARIRAAGIKVEEGKDEA